MSHDPSNFEQAENNERERVVPNAETEAAGDIGAESASGLVEHFFRREYGKLVATLGRVFGVRHLQLAEDTVQQALIEALQRWKTNGVPERPAAWIYRVARNRLIDVLRREELQERFEAEIESRSQGGSSRQSPYDRLFNENEIADSQLRMMFVCCHPSLRAEDQIALTLKTLCGFGNRELSRGFLVGEETIRKRIFRAKQNLVETGITFELPQGSDLDARRDSVHQVLYLMFNEGYSSSGDSMLRQDVCEEAAGLCDLLCDSAPYGNRETEALLALMLFHAARFATRLDSEGSLLLLEDQDRSRWDRALIAEANRRLVRAFRSESVGRFHLEAAIAMQHCTANSFGETRWDIIKQLYDRLLEFSDSPIYRLNRAVVLAELEGLSVAMRELDKIADCRELSDYHLLDACYADLHRRQGNGAAAIAFYRRALSKNPPAAERQFLERRLTQLDRS